MSIDNPDQEIEVEDEEGYVDRQRKQDIIESRRKVIQVQERVFSAAARGEMKQEYACRMWHESIRVYLLSIEPLLRDFDLPNAEEAYLHTKLGEVTLSPPPELQSEPESGKEIAERGFKLLSDPISPEKEPIHGLKEIIENDGYSQSWKVRINQIKGLQAKRQGPHTETVTAEEHMPKMALMNAVREADQFLQEANVGLALGTGDPHGVT
ncbi:hypothetical protein C475_11705 [Halosimplex carlsbadense 2-9-1]|uniref:Uncharacterized protein n=1 Tax=Halosimplex carlsbadense 2-9-1 TaxID=797114 RepID=M0CNQ3_9EURY|nr:hypothetical protein [Halosimplex carlsbadense]ELZ24900.1 hypothetical protein C475_11705 [Halosimplex carlsbadense 2-9-1]